MTPVEFIGLATAVGLAIKSSDWIAVPVKAYFVARKERKLQLTQLQIEQRKIDQLAQVDVSKVKRDEFQVLIDVAVLTATNANQRAEAAEDERDAEKRLREECEIGLRGEINNLKINLDQLSGEHKSCDIKLEQVERNFRFLCDASNIAYWEIDSLGHCTINETFYQITGMGSEECAAGGWLNAVHEDHRNDITNRWNNFRRNFQTHTLMKFSFKHAAHGAVTEVVAECSTIMSDGLKVHKYTARTKPLNRN